MSFKSIIEDIDNGLKKFFGSPITAEVAQTGISIAEIAFPALTPMLQGVGKSIAVVQGLAKQAGTTVNASSEQTIALIVADAQAAFQAYQTATGSSLETDTQKAIVADLVTLLSKIPAAGTPTQAPPAA